MAQMMVFALNIEKILWLKGENARGIFLTFSESSNYAPLQKSVGILLCSGRLVGRSVRPSVGMPNLVQMIT